MNDNNKPDLFFAMFIIALCLCLISCSVKNPTPAPTQTPMPKLSLSVVSLLWQRTIQVETLKMQHHSDATSAPDGAINITNHHSTTTYTDLCWKTKVDSKGHLSSGLRPCQKTRERYYVSYDAPGWEHDSSQDVVISGTQHDERVWPTFVPIGNENDLGSKRESGRIEALWIRFQDSAGNTYDFPCADSAKWRTFSLNTAYQVAFDGQPHWDTLEPRDMK